MKRTIESTDIDETEREFKKPKYFHTFSNEFTELFPYLIPGKTDEYFAHCTVCSCDFSIKYGGLDDCWHHIEIHARSQLATLDTKVIPAPALGKYEEVYSQESCDVAADLPAFWAPMERGAPVMAFEVVPDTEEYRALACLFYETCPFGDYDIARIIRVQNPILWKYFSRKQSQMIHENNGMDVIVKWLYHGTHHSKLEAIARKGFDPRLSGKHGAVYGNGSYFARSAQYSHLFTDCAGNGVSVGGVVGVKNGISVGSGISVKSGVSVGSGISVKSGVSVKSGISIKKLVSIGSGISVKSGVSVGSGISVKKGVSVGSGTSVKSGVSVKSGISVKSGVSFGNGISVKTGGTSSNVLQSGGTPSSVLQSGGTPSYVLQSGGTSSYVLQSGGTSSSVLQSGGTSSSVLQSGGTSSSVLQSGGTSSYVLQSAGTSSSVLQSGGTSSHVLQTSTSSLSHHSYSPPRHSSPLGIFPTLQFLNPACSCSCQSQSLQSSLLPGSCICQHREVLHNQATVNDAACGSTPAAFRSSSLDLFLGTSTSSAGTSMLNSSSQSPPSLLSTAAPPQTQSTHFDSCFVNPSLPTSGLGLVQTTSLPALSLCDSMKDKKADIQIKPDPDHTPNCSGLTTVLQCRGKGTANLSSAFACDANSKTHFMFVAKVLVGRQIRGKSGLNRPPPLNDSNPYGKCYDSCVDDIYSPLIYVIFDSNQAYPEYIIEYNWHKS